MTLILSTNHKSLCLEGIPCPKLFTTIDPRSYLPCCSYKALHEVGLSWTSLIRPLGRHMTCFPAYSNISESPSHPTSASAQLRALLRPPNRYHAVLKYSQSWLRLERRPRCWCTSHSREQTLLCREGWHKLHRLRACCHRREDRICDQLRDL